jgi:hypothetical protein
MNEQRANDVGNQHFCDPMPNNAVALFKGGLWEFGIDTNGLTTQFLSGSVCPFCKTDLIGENPE